MGVMELFNLNFIDWMSVFWGGFPRPG